MLLALTFFLGVLSVLCSWTEITESVGFFHLNLLWILAGITGVFLALDLFLFYFAWELMLVPMYFLIALWGHEHRTYAAISTRRYLDHARILCRFCRQAASVSVAHLAARRSYRSPDCGKRDSRRASAKDRSLRDDPLRRSSVP